MAKDTIWVHF